VIACGSDFSLFGDLQSVVHLNAQVANGRCKPGTFARWVLRDVVFPRSVCRQTWERLAAARPEREACNTMVGLLVLAADGHEE
jgi:hypothetical protein